VTFPSPAPAGPYSNAAPQGTATFASTFNGISPNGSWALYVLDHASGGGAGSISGGWCVNLTENSTAPTTTTVTSNNNPSFTASPDNLVTFTATVTAASGTPVTQGTVTFTNGSLPIAGCMNVALDGLGEAQCATSFSTEGSFQIIANYGGSPSFALAPSSGSVKQLVDNHPVVTGNQFCNTSGITLNDGGTATPYPSNIFVSGLLGTIRKVTLTLNGLTESTPSDLTMLLVGPNGRTFIPFSDVGGASPVTEINITLDDGAASLLQAPLTSGTFKPSNFLTSGVTFPSPAPAGPYSSAAPAGTATFGQLFNSTVPNGTWSLYIRDRAINAGTRDRIATWCLAYERELSRQQSHPGTREVPPRK
jgi:hypothetical protein